MPINGLEALLLMVSGGVGGWLSCSLWTDYSAARSENYGYQLGYSEGWDDGKTLGTPDTTPLYDQEHDEPGRSFTPPF